MSTLEKYIYIFLNMKNRYAIYQDKQIEFDEKRSPIKNALHYNCIEFKIGEKREYIQYSIYEKSITYTESQITNFLRLIEQENNLEYLIIEFEKELLRSR